LLTLRPFRLKLILMKTSGFKKILLDFKYVFAIWLVSSGIIYGASQFYGRHLERKQAIARWNGFIEEINGSVSKFPSNASVIIKDFKNGFTYEYNPYEKFISASLIKLPVMCSVFQKISEGALSFDQQIILKSCYRVAGSGYLRFECSGKAFKVIDLIRIMISESDNTAAKMLTETVGYDEMNKTFASIGLHDTNITPKSFCMARYNTKDESYTTPRDITRLLETIYQGKFISPEMSQDIINILKLPNENNRLRRYLPEEYELAHKTGLLRGACHDAGIVFTPRGDFMICIMTEQNRSYRTAKRFIADLGKLAYEQI
jgi:beta-lactamase class A